MTDAGDPTSLGRFIREQRELSRYSIREMARLASISNAYLSQVERGVHAPSLRVLRALAEAVGMPVEAFVSRGPGVPTSRSEEKERHGDHTEAAIRRDPRLDPEQKSILLELYQQFVR